MIQWRGIGQGSLAAWPWATNLSTVSGSVAEGQLFWPCDDLNTPPSQACDWLSARKVRFAWQLDSGLGMFDGEEVIEAGERAYRSDLFGDGSLVRLGDPVETFMGMVETRGLVDREESPGGSVVTSPLWSAWFDEVRVEDFDAWTFRARLHLGLPVPALRGGDPGWTLAGYFGGTGPLLVQFEVQRFADDFSGPPVFVGLSGGLTIVGDDGGLVGAHASGFYAEVEVVEYW